MRIYILCAYICTMIDTTSTQTYKYFLNEDRTLFIEVTYLTPKGERPVPTKYYFQGVAQIQDWDFPTDVLESITQAIETKIYHDNEREKSNRARLYGKKH